MQERINKLALVGIVLSSILFILIIVSSINQKCDCPDVWVAGKYGKTCYLLGHENKTITSPIYFIKLEDCENYIQKNK